MYGEVVKLLLAKDGVNPDFKDKGNGTPLLWAVENGHETVVKHCWPRKASIRTSKIKTIEPSSRGQQKTGTRRW